MKNSTVGITVSGGNGLGNNANQLIGPVGVAVDQKGNIFIADTDNHRIQKWMKNSTVGITVAGGNGQGNNANQLKYPDGVVVDEKGNIFIVDTNNNRIQK